MTPLGGAPPPPRTHSLSDANFLVFFDWFVFVGSVWRRLFAGSQTFAVVPGGEVRGGAEPPEGAAGTGWGAGVRLPR